MSALQYLTQATSFRFSPACGSFLALLVSIFAQPLGAQTFGCSPAMANDIVCENSKPGDPAPNWSIAGTGDSTIQGFATALTLAHAGFISFQINTNASSST